MLIGEVKLPGENYQFLLYANIIMMKKIIHEYEERNKVIEAIEKNLRMGHSKNHKSPQKFKD